MGVESVSDVMGTLGKGGGEVRGYVKERSGVGKVDDLPPLMGRKVVVG